MLKIKWIKFVNDPVFKNKMFDFTTRSNDVASTVIIVGENGSGKTRLINILKQLTDFIFVNDKRDFWLKKVNNVYRSFTKQEIEHNNDFYLNAWEYEIEYEYTFTPNEEKLFESEDWIPSSNLKNQFNVINSILRNKVYFTLHISTSFNNENMQNNNYKIIINDVYLFNDKINKEQNTELNRRILFKLRDQVISNVMVSPDSWYNTDFIFGLLVKDFQYTYYFDTLQELSKSNEKNNQSYEEFLLNVYKEEFNIENVDYNFSSSLTINSLKLNKYVEAINNFLNDTSNNENSLQLYKIYKNKVYFKKSNNNIYYEELSTGEKKLLSESIFWLKLFFQKHTNSEENYVNKLNINKQINMLYFIDEIELGFHPVWNTNILNFLKKCLENAYGQIFITTHSEIIPYSINIKTDTLINMNDDNEIISFKNYNSIQDFVNNSLHVDYEDFIDEYDIWVEGRTDKVLLDNAIQLLSKNEFIPFNIRFANNFKSNKNSSDHNDDLNKEFNELMNGAVGVRTQFLSWLSKNNKEENKSLKYQIKPKCFIFDNDKSGQEKFNSVKKLLEENKQKRIFNKIKIDSNEISDKNNIFKGYKVIRTINDESENAFILIYKNQKEKEIEDFIQDEKLREDLKHYKSDEKQKNSLLNKESNKEIIADSFKDYIDDLKDILGIKD